MSKFEHYSKVHLRNGMSGAEIAQKMLEDHGIRDEAATLLSTPPLSPTITRFISFLSFYDFSMQMAPHEYPTPKPTNCILFFAFSGYFLKCSRKAMGIEDEIVLP